MSQFPIPARNFSPWYQVVSRLMRTEREDPLPVDSLSSFEPWRERFRIRLDQALAWAKRGTRIMR